MLYFHGVVYAVQRYIMIPISDMVSKQIYMHLVKYIYSAQTRKTYNYNLYDIEIKSDINVINLPSIDGRPLRPSLT